jgi:hypothetical protein
LREASSGFLIERANIEGIMSELPSENQFADIPLTEDDSRFSPDEMRRCAACGRSVPPNRTSCMYCGKPILSEAIDMAAAKINLQRPEPWEDGFSLVYSGKAEPSAETISTASEIIQADNEQIAEALQTRTPVPLIYLKSLPDAELLASRLAEIGFGCAVVGDDLLQARTPPTRLRSILFESDGVFLEDFNSGKFVRADREEQMLIVAGRLVRTSIEISGKIKKRVLSDANETTSSKDEAVIDLYPKNDVYGFRIRAAGFDFSCLGDRMGPLAAANMTELIEKIRREFQDTVFIDSTSVTDQLGLIWPPTETRESGGVSRSIFGGIRKESTTMADNTLQFTKFSRLQRHF